MYKYTYKYVLYCSIRGLCVFMHIIKDLDMGFQVAQNQFVFKMACKSQCIIVGVCMSALT